MEAEPDQSIELPDDASSAGRARLFVERSAVGQVEGADDVVLMTSELVSNVVEHVGGAIEVTVRRGPPIRIEVHNHRGATEAFRDLVHAPVMPDRSASHGRGLALVRRLASRIGLDDDPRGGKVVWFEYEPAAMGEAPASASTRSA